MTDYRARWPMYYTVVLLLCAAVFISYIDRTNISVGAVAMKAQFGWTETQKGLVLSSFFIGYIVLMVASASLANHYGGKLVLGVAVIWWSLFTALTPPAALLSLSGLVCTRIALGLGEAAVFPASMNMIGRWVPPLNRSRAVALLTSTIYLGTVFSLPMTGWLVRNYGWPVPFYAFGALGFVWAVIWFAGVRGSSGIEPPFSTARPAIPWGKLARSSAVWAIVVAHFCNNWSLYVLLAWLPSYFKSTFNVSITNAGLLSAAPWLTSFLMANVAGHWADYLLRSGRSATFVRKLMQTIALGGTAIFLLQLPGAGSVTAGAVLMCCATGSLAFGMAGFAPNPFDIAPRFADVIWGISNTFATLPGIVGVFVTGWLVDRTGSFSAPFFLMAGVVLLGAVVYLAFASGERQVI
jgi:MFS transporter, ACS family, solute carrier family 17 (sodium-dependent inorganic phosphate cotransporter), other